MACKHGEGAKPYPCDQCEKAFFEPRELKIHISIRHEGERAFSCDFCTEAFTRKSAMRRHIKRKHSDMISTTVFLQNSPNHREAEENLAMTLSEEPSELLT